MPTTTYMPMQLYESPPTKMVAPLHSYDGNLLHKKQLFQQKLSSFSSRTQVNFQSSDENDEGPLNINLPSGVSQTMMEEQKSGINLFQTAAFKCGIDRLNKSAVPFSKSK